MSLKRNIIKMKSLVIKYVKPKDEYLDNPEIIDVGWFINLEY